MYVRYQVCKVGMYADKDAGNERCRDTQRRMRRMRRMMLIMMICIPFLGSEQVYKYKYQMNANAAAVH